MSDNANCEEQREEQTELEEAGGAEVRCFKSALSRLGAVYLHLSGNCHSSLNFLSPLLLI